MTKVAYFESTKVQPGETPRRYQVVTIDKEKEEITLKGEHGPFKEPYSRERFEKLGYTLIVEEKVDE
jgi:hypothetical protein